mmetsp:Transcript_60755/g.162440  ORF Transcript_60755/g.162440 Transcript_60755/m.162440 type:complete len:147 (+) Transcript_60755:153-593(+)
MHTQVHNCEFSRTRAILNKSKALAIFKFRGKKPAKAVGAMYGVGERAVRDVWSGRTWSHVTKAVPRKFSSMPIHPCFVDCIPQTANNPVLQEDHFDEPVKQGGLQPFVHLIFTHGPTDVDRMLEYWDQGYDVLLPLEDDFVDREIN